MTGLELFTVLTSYTALKAAVGIVIVALLIYFLTD